MKKVSVVIPAYNRPEMVEDAISSVINQSYKNIEIIVVDDHSPEPLKGTVDIIQNKKVHYFRFNENRGANAARNKGISESTGDYIAFLDDDDIWETDKVQKQADVLEKNSSVGLVYTGQQFIDEEGNVFKVKLPNASGDVRKHLLKGGSIAPFSCLMVRKELINKVGKLDPKMPSLQDREWLLRLSKHTSFYPVEEPLVIRRHGHDRIGDNYEALRDYTYPLIYKKHRETAREVGIRYQFYFKSALLKVVGSSALRNGYYSDARKYLFKSWVYYPFSTYVILRLLIALGGKVSYKTAKVVRDAHQQSK